MQRQPNPEEQDAHTDNALIGLLIYDDSQRPWSVDEVEREIGDDTRDSLARLHGAGLLNRVEDFVWPSRAAVIAHGMEL